jgi:hypothetical protein
MRLSIAVLLAAVILAPFGAASAGEAGTDGKDGSAAGRIGYWKDIHPILGELCARCHGIGSAKGELRLDTRALLLEGGRGGHRRAGGGISGREGSRLRQLFVSPVSPTDFSAAFLASAVDHRAAAQRRFWRRWLCRPSRCSLITSGLCFRNAFSIS